VEGREKEMKQSWHCKKCLAQGEIKFKDDAGIMEVVCLIEDQHKAASPGCDQYIGRIRLGREEDANQKL
jgi:L-amino acid N-acyltransferase YncA